MLHAITDRIADAIGAELRRQHAAIIAERDAALARAATAETLLQASRAAVLDLEAAIAGMSRAQRAPIDGAPAALVRQREIDVHTVDALKGMRPALPGAASPDAKRPTCAICDRPLDPATMRAAEMSIGGDWYAPGNVPAGVESQGIFDVGSDCYRKRVKDPIPATLTRQRKAAAKNAAATMDTGAAPETPKRNPDRNADRGLVLREALRVACPHCEAKAGEQCEGRASPHPERLGTARARLDDVKRRMAVRCPVCDAAEHAPCVVDGRRGLHKERGV